MADWTRQYALNLVPLGDSEYESIGKLDNELDYIFTLLNTLRITFTMEDQASDVTTAANAMALYCKSVGGDSEAFIRGESNATALQWTQDAGVRLRGAGMGGPLTVTQNSQTVGLSHDGTDAGLDLNKGDLIIQTSEGTNTTTDVIIKGKGTEEGTLSVKGPSDTDYLKISHDGTDAYIVTDDGSFIFQTAEAAPTDTSVEIKGNGVAKGQLIIHDDSATNKAIISVDDSIGQDVTFLIPADTPADGEVLTADGVTGKTKWATVTAAPTGYLAGFDYAYKDADELTFEGGAIEIDGVMYTLEAQTDVDMDLRLGGAFANSTWYAIYIDPPASGTTLAVADFETVALGGAGDPAYDQDTFSWRHPTNTDWRCIGFYYIDSGGSIQECYTSGGWFFFKDGYMFLNTGAPASTITLLSVGTPAIGYRHVINVHAYSYKAGSSNYLCLWNGDNTGWTHNISRSHSSAPTSGGVNAGWQILITNASDQITYSSLNGDATVVMHLVGFQFPRGMR